jgi:hypothetical protein
MPATRTNRRNVIEGRREVDGFTIRFTAIFIAASDLWDVKVVDHSGEQTRDFASGADPMDVWGVTAELIEAAVAACHARAKDMAGVD